MLCSNVRGAERRKAQPILMWTILLSGSPRLPALPAAFAKASAGQARFVPNACGRFLRRSYRGLRRDFSSRSVLPGTRLRRALPGFGLSQSSRLSAGRP
jgi:hypothetical protein